MGNLWPLESWRDSWVGWELNSLPKPSWCLKSSPVDYKATEHNPAQPKAKVPWSPLSQPAGHRPDPPAFRSIAGVDGVKQKLGQPAEQAVPLWDNLRVIGLGQSKFQACQQTDSHSAEQLALVRESGDGQSHYTWKGSW